MTRKGCKRNPESLRKFIISMTGKKHSEETKKKMSEVKKGCVFSEEHKKKLSISAIERCKRPLSEETRKRRIESQLRRHRSPEEIERMRQLGYSNIRENNGQWKGDKVGYTALHDYIKYHLPKSDLCEICKLVPPYDLANISGKYLRDLNDWEWLCRKCHMEKDGRLFNLIQNRKKRNE